MQDRAQTSPHSLSGEGARLLSYCPLGESVFGQERPNLIYGGYELPTGYLYIPYCKRLFYHMSCQDTNAKVR